MFVKYIYLLALLYPSRQNPHQGYPFRPNQCSCWPNWPDTEAQ